MVKIGSTRNFRKRLGRSKPHVLLFVGIVFLWCSIRVVKQFLFLRLMHNPLDNLDWSSQVEQAPQNENPGSTSVFNCNGEYGKCKYFYPSQFFSRTKNNEGAKYADLYDHYQVLKEKGELWRHMPPILFLILSLEEEQYEGGKTESFQGYRNVTFIHNHKAGGTSVHFQSRMKRRPRKTILLYHHKQLERAMNPANAMKTRDKLLGARLRRKLRMRVNDPRLSLGHIKNATKYKYPLSEWKEGEHLFFGIIRDPLDRFVSSVGQAMGARGSSGNHVSKSLMQICVKDTNHYTLENSQFMLQCCIDFVKDVGYEVEIHFTPQALEFAFATQMHPVPVAIFKFEESYEELMLEMGLNPNKKDREGSKVRSSPMLRNVTSADYTDDLRRQVCELYEMDVKMFHSLGWGTKCDGFI